MISGLVFGGTPAAALAKVFSQDTLVVSPEMLEEYRRIAPELYREGKITEAQLTALVAAIAAFVAQAVVVSPRTKVALCRDPADNHLLECCLESSADVLLSGDKDLLDVPASEVERQIPGLRIQTPREFSGG